MFYSLVAVMKNLDGKIKKIMKNGLKFSFAIAFISFWVLFTYEVIYSAPIVYYIGIKLFNLSLSFAASFLICAIIIDSLKKVSI